MSEDVRRLCDRIDALIEASERATAPPLAEIERTLTDGYAQAHKLEGERRRLERNIASLAAAEGDAKQKAAELSKLSARATRSAEELERLRELLADLRRHHAAVPAA
jgi:hypothetical protein